MNSNTTQTFPKGDATWSDDGVDEEHPDLPDAADLDLLGLDAGHAAPHATESDTGEVAAPAKRARQGKDGRQDAVAPDLRVGECAEAEFPDFVEAVHLRIGLCYDVSEFHLYVSINPLWISVVDIYALRLWHLNLDLRSILLLLILGHSLFLQIFNTHTSGHSRVIQRLKQVLPAC